jgi:flagellin FlaB
MGVGTMIIFIAMVLVAAVAASVLISTANKVREQAQNTGDQAINNVASGFVVQDVTGTVDATYASMTDLTIQMRLQAGSPNMNMDLVSIQFVSGQTNNMLAFVAGSSAAAGGAVAGTSYSANTTNNNAWTSGNHVVQQGDMITVTITGLDLSYSAAATVKIVPAYGSATLISFVTPSYYNTEFVNLK